MIASRLFHPERLSRFKPFDVFAPAVAYIEQSINRHLGAVPIQLVWNSARQRPERKISPRNLLEGLWLQFADSIHTGHSFRACHSCKRWFELTPTIARTSKLYCSTACRNRAYRDRQKKAYVLNDQGKSAKEIARELDTDIKTVKKWLKAANE